MSELTISFYLLRELRSALLAPFRTEFGVMTVAFSDAGSSMNDVTETLERQGVEIPSLSAEVEGGHSRYTIQVRIPPGRSVHTPLEEISALPHVEQVNITGLREAD